MNISGRIRYFLLLGLLFWHQTVQSLEPFTESTSLWSHEQYQPVFFDFNQDKTLDLLLQAKSGSETSLFILGQPDSDTTFSPHNSLKLPTQIAGLDWSVSEAQLLPLRIKTNGETGLIVIFPQRKAAAMFRFDGKNLDFSRPIAKYQSSQWPFLANVAGHELHVADFDRDGVDEILQLDKLSGEHQILNLQSNFSVLKTQTIKPKVAWGSHGQSRIIIRDFDNNGFADIVALAKRPDAKHYLILADQYGKFSHAEPQELSSNFDGLSWFDNGSGTLVVKRRSDQRPVLLRLFSEHEQSQASAQNCVGWLYDPLSKTSQEYCLKAVSSANGPKQASTLKASNFESTEIVPTNALNECPIIEFSVSASGVSEVLPDNQCPSMPQRPTAAPILEGSSFQVNQTFRMQLMNTRDPNALTYEAMATLNGDDYVEIASTIAAANDVYPSITVSGRLSVAGHYQVRYRSCNHQGCSGFGPASALQILAAPVSFLVSTNAETGGSISPTSTSVIQGSSTSFTVTPLNGFSINTMTGCGGNLSGNTYTTGAISSVCTVRATFVANPVYHTVTATSDGNGSISSASRLVEHGNSTSFTVTPHSGYRINTVTGCGGN
ncbi:MAG: InlB B-repeat-containing protein, partial [Rheinheimera sp.]